MSCKPRQQRELNLELRFHANQHAQVKPLSRCRVPTMIATSAASCLLIGYVKIAMRGSRSSLAQGVSVGRVDRREVMQAAGKSASFQTVFDFFLVKTFEFRLV